MNQSNHQRPMKRRIIACYCLLASLLAAVLFCPSQAADTPTPGVLTAAGISKDWQKLEGPNNHGTADLELEGTQARIAGAVARPFAIGDAQASVSGQVRVLLPERRTCPDFGSAMLGLYGKNREQRLVAFIAFKLPGMNSNDCEIGFIAHKSIRRPASFGQWYTLKLETKGGIARMKAWADGTPEPDWMVEEYVDSILGDIDAAGLRTYGLPVVFEGFAVSGQPAPKLPKTTLGSEAQGITGVLRRDGSLEELRLRYADGWQKVEFRRDGRRGPGFGKSIPVEPEAGDPLAFAGEKDSIRYRLAYAVVNGGLCLTATLENTGKTEFAPERLPLLLGIDTFMNTYPRWNEQFFPTLLRCEGASFWGYMMTPHGRILGITSPDPVGSYTIEYLRQMYAHHIHTISLDLLQEPPVPGQHPAYAPLAPGQQRTWTVNLIPVETLETLKPRLAARAKAPMLDLYRYSLEPGQPAEMRVFSSSSVSAIIVSPAGTEVTCPVGNKQGNLYQATFPDTVEYGEYRVRIQDGAGKTATGQFFVHPPWSWYLKQARLEALRLTPRADSSEIDGFSCESYYGLLGFSLAAKHFPDPAIDVKGDRLLEKVLERLFREKDGMRFSGNPERITNGEFMISLLVLRYAATGDLKSLEMASEFAEYLLSRQHKDCYYGGYGMANYNAVLYPTKAIMELMAAEKPLVVDSPKWQQRYERHAQSIKRAVDHMVAQGRDVKTEGSGTFEDGAVSCTAAQIAMFALQQTDQAERAKYTAAARQFLADHACLTRLLDTDSRSIGGTARWWEAWNDEKRSAQMMTSPHGWSGWRLYAVYYLYLLTGEEQHLRGLMNALGACTQLLEWPSGRLRQAFVIDPHVRNVEHFPDPANPRWGRTVETVTCEDYIGTIGDWWSPTTKGDGYLDRAEWGWTGDGIPYEIFKAMEEIALTQAFVIERADGTIIGYNCGVSLKDKTIEVIPAEIIVQRVHVNLKTPRQVRVSFANERVSANCQAGTQWLTTKKVFMPSHL
jgi:hypothetical protein